jgi:hypothetical protein
MSSMVEMALRQGTLKRDRTPPPRSKASQRCAGALVWRNLAGFGSLNSFREFTGILNHKQPDHPVMDQIALGDHI